VTFAVTTNYSGTTKYEYLSGKGKWVKVFQPDTTPNGGQRWKVDLYPDPTSLEIIKKLKEEGLLNHMRQDDDGYNMTFARPTQKIMKGRLVAFPPPVVLDKDLKPLENVAIGNGSDITIKLEIYKYPKPGGEKGQKGIAARLIAVRVDNLVPFEPARDFTDVEAVMAKGIENVPTPIF
jgi:hypothetical protein